MGDAVFVVKSDIGNEIIGDVHFFHFRFGYVYCIDYVVNKVCMRKDVYDLLEPFLIPNIQFSLDPTPLPTIMMCKSISSTTL